MFKTFIVAVVLVGASLTSHAQIKEEELSVKHIFGMDRREIFKQKVKMSSSDSMSFWPVFDQYEIDRMRISLDRLKLVNTFLTKYSKVTDEEITVLMQDAMDLESNQFKLIDTYYKKFRNSVPPRVVAQWMQLEFYINLAVKLAWQERLPFVGDAHLKPL